MFYEDRMLRFIFHNIINKRRNVMISIGGGGLLGFRRSTMTSSTYSVCCGAYTKHSVTSRLNLFQYVGHVGCCGRKEDMVNDVPEA